MGKQAIRNTPFSLAAMSKPSSGFRAYLLPWLCAGLLAFALISPATAGNEIDLTQLTLEELMDVRIRPVISASKYAQRPLDAPSSMTVITADEIQRYGYRTMADVLRGVRGFYIRNDRNYEYVGFRGMSRLGDYSTRVLLLVDGASVNDSIYTSAAIGKDFILDLDLISRIEIVRGPSYTLYGNNAFFAVINVITKNSDELNGLELSGSAGRFRTYEGRFSYGKGFSDESQLIFSGTLFDSGGQSLYYPEFDTPDQNNGVAEDCDGESARSFFAKYSRHGITLSSAYAKRAKQVPTASWGTAFNDSGTEVWDERVFLDAKLERKLDSGFDVTAKATYGFYRYDGDYFFIDEASTDSYINIDEAEGHWWGIDLHTVRPFGKHTLIVGMEFRDNFILDQINFDKGGAHYLNDRHDSMNWGVFIQDEFPLFSQLKLNAGLRYDHYSTFGDSLNPRIALIYRPFADTAIKYLAGKSFRGPNPYELYYNDGDVTQRSNPDLKEESLISHEVVWEQLFGQHFSGTFTVYHYDIDELISLTTGADGLLVFENLDDVEANGFEVELDAFSKEGFKAGLSYALQDSDYKNSDKTWINSPRQLAKLQVSVPVIAQQLFLGLEEQYTSKLQTLSGEWAGNYFTTNVTLFWKQMLKNIDLSASVYNLFDREYDLPASDENIQDAIEQDGIHFRVKLTCRF